MPGKGIKNVLKLLEVYWPVFIILGLIVSCNSKNYPVEHVNTATVIEHTYNKRYGLAFGVEDTGSTLYVMYGKTPYTNDIEGTGVAPDHRFYFSLQEMVNSHPELNSLEVEKAIKRQLKKWVY